MLKRGRKTPGDLTFNGQPSRLKPPASLRDDERSLFLDIVNNCPAEHFVKTDLPLVTSYAQACAMSHRNAGDADMIAIWAAATRVQCALASKLRLAPSARDDRRKVGHRQMPFANPPWEA
jgi:hypothetical protein